MAKPPPIIQNGILTYLLDGSPVRVAVDSSDWQDWLQSASTFTFRDEQGGFTARKEQAGNRRGRPYWRAYHTRQGKLQRVYLGQSEELTLDRLSTIAALLAGLEAGGDSLSGQVEATVRHVSPAPSSNQAQHPPLGALESNRVKARSFFSELPAPLTPLIGREQERTALCHLLQRPEVRLVTLTGTGGVGKTRMALEVATDLREEFADSVHFISLAPISDPELVIPSIAGTLVIKETAAQSLLALLKAALQNKHLLLVLDNFEQLLPAAPHLTELLASCPGLKLLVTSRSTLHVQGEHEFVVPPLAVPDLAQLPTLADLARVETVRLFVERVQALKADFALTEGNARAIAEICVRLDGLPLAIELAAARSKLLPPQALLKRLSHRLAVLTGGAQDLPERQQTLRNTIQWSYDLLTKQEQRLFRRLSIFVGGCTLEAAEALGRAAGDEVSVLEGAASLLDKSLVLQTERAGDAPLLVLLETLREFGLECLEREGELGAAREAYTHYYLELAEQAGLELQGPKQTTWLGRLEQEHDNLRAVLAWGLEETTEEMTERRELALRLCAALELFWVMHGHYSEARTFLERALASREGESASLRARVLQATANIAQRQGDYDRSEVLAQQSLALYRELEETRGIARSLDLLQEIASVRGKSAESLAFAEEWVRLMRQIGGPGEVAEALFVLADQVSTQGEYARGQSLYEEALLLFRTAGNDLWVGATLLRSAFYLCWSASGDAATVRQRLQQGQALITRAGDRNWMAHSASHAALIALAEGETARAYALAQESLALYREIGFRWYIVATLYILGWGEAQRGDLSAARSRYLESLAIARELGEKLITPLDLEGLAAVLATQGELRWAAQLWGAAEVLREETAYPLPPVHRPGYERAVAAAREHMGEQAFSAAWEEGRMMTPEQALAAQGPANSPPPRQARPLSIPPAKTSPRYPAGLTAREIDVLRLVAQGLSDAQVAEELVISPRTVNWHLTSIYSKLQVSSRGAATRYAIEQHLV